MRKGLALATAAMVLGLAGAAQAQGAGAIRPEEVDAAAKAVEAKTVAWRRDLHAHPELGNTEKRTAALVADHLRKLGYEVKTGVAGTGVVATLKGGRPGKTVALRADMDALPVKEETGLPFASKAKGTYQGREVDVMHACGHDAHVAMLMATAEVLAGMRERLPGTVRLIFQPAEEGPSDFEPDGKRIWGAALMVKEGAMAAPKVDAVFGLHVFAKIPTGKLMWRPGPEMASTDLLKIRVEGKQTHGAQPWQGIDPIVAASQVVLGLQTIISRQSPIVKEPALVTVGKFNAGTRYNIIPQAVEMEGTIRTFDDAMQDDIHQRIKRTAENIAEASGAKATVEIVRQYPVTSNDLALTERMAPTLQRVGGQGAGGMGGWGVADKTTTAEDFSFLARQAPGLFLFLGVTPPDKLETAAGNHAPGFDVDERALPVGVRALSHLAVDYLQGT
jgi:amidohydrolase